MAAVERSVAAYHGEREVVKAALRWLVSNFPLMVLALILAILAWVVAVEEEDPTLEERYPQPIPITPSELPEGMVIVGDFDERVQVTVRAPKSVRNSLKVDDFTATVHLAGLDAGVHKVPVQVVLNKRPSQVMLVEPEYVTLEVEPKAERSVPVRVQIEGKPALGYFPRAPIVASRQVTVSGPSTYVARVVETVIQVSVQNAKSTIEGEFELRLQDSEGQSVPYVTLTPEVVSVRIPIESTGYYSTLGVKAVLEGQPAPDYHITYISVEPPTVTVFGAPDVVAALPGFIETEPVDIEGAQADVIERPTLTVPPNVIVVPGPSPVEIKVSIEAIQSSLTMEVTPEIQGLGPGLTATVSPETVGVILSGPLPLLETLEADDVRVVLDLFGLPLGTHQIEPQVSQVVVPEGLTAQSILPATVQVTISTWPTPTPGESSQRGDRNGRLI
jgi:YbbR domain-containing protein